MSKEALRYARKPHWWYMLITIVIAVVLSVIPLPGHIKIAWPDWIALVVFYWVLILPSQLGVMYGWLIGLLEDIVSFSLLGQHALAKAFIGTIAAILSRRIHVFNFIEQIILVFVVQSVSIAIDATINNFAYSTPITAMMWQPAMTTCLIWPVFKFLLDQFDPNSHG